MKRMMLMILSALITFPVVAQEIDQYGLKKSAERYVKKQSAPKGFVEQSVDKYMAPMGEKQQAIAKKELPTIQPSQQLESLDKKLQQIPENKFQIAQQAYQDAFRAQVPKSVCKNGKLAKDAIRAFREKLALNVPRTKEIYRPSNIMYRVEVGWRSNGPNSGPKYESVNDVEIEYVLDRGCNDMTWVTKVLGEKDWTIEQKCQLEDAGFSKDGNLVVSCKCREQATGEEFVKFGWKMKTGEYTDVQDFAYDGDLWLPEYSSGNIVYPFCSSNSGNKLRNTKEYKEAYQYFLPLVEEGLASYEERAAQKHRTQETLELYEQEELEEAKRRIEEANRRDEERKQKEKEKKCEQWRADVAENFGIVPKPTECGTVHMSFLKAYLLASTYCGGSRMGFGRNMVPTEMMLCSGEKGRYTTYKRVGAQPGEEMTYKCYGGFMEVRKDECSFPTIHVNIDVDEPSLGKIFGE